MRWSLDKTRYKLPSIPQIPHCPSSHVWQYVQSAASQSCCPTQCPGFFLEVNYVGIQNLCGWPQVLKLHAPRGKAAVPTNDIFIINYPDRLTVWCEALGRQKQSYNTEDFEGSVPRRYRGLVRKMGISWACAGFEQPRPVELTLCW